MIDASKYSKFFREEFGISFKDVDNPTEILDPRLDAFRLIGEYSREGIRFLIRTAPQHNENIMIQDLDLVFGTKHAAYIARSTAYKLLGDVRFCAEYGIVPVRDITQGWTPGNAQALEGALEYIGKKYLQK